MTLNRNIVLFTLQQFFTGAGAAIGFFVILSPLLYILTNDFLYIGYAEGAQGLVGALVSLPSGYVADKFSRSLVFRTGLTISCASYIGMAIVIWFSFQIKEMSMYWILFSMLVLEGIGSGIGVSPLSALLSDSITTGKRSFYNSISSAAYMIGSLCGPLCAILLIVVTSREEWTISDMCIPWTAGLVLRIIGYILGMFMSDKHSLGRESEDIGKERVKKGEIYKCGCFTSERHIPYLLVCSDILFGIASGMTVKFFPLWLQKEIKLTPIQLNGAVAGQFFAIAVLGFVALAVGKRIGRMQTVLCGKILGLCSMIAIIIGDGHYWQIQWIAISLNVLRTGLMNCGGVLLSSILGDYVCKENRGRWQAMDMITSFGWSGSALFGAWLLDSFQDNHGYRTLFVITLMMQVVAMTPLWIIVFLIPRKEESIADVINHDIDNNTINYTALNTSINTSESLFKAGV